MPAVSYNRRIARNALMLYVRMFFTMIVGLYTSRVVLATLGVEDYGIYGVVGGVVGMMGFLNASLSGATSRFITFELGRRQREDTDTDPDRLRDTFSSALIIHIAIALVVLIAAETVGLWFLENKLVIPPERMAAARWVYQLSILSAMFTITQVPYNATIIAHEKMDVYAYVEILNVSLKLLIVYLLVIGDFDKLKLYSVLTLIVSLLILMIYRFYCIRHFDETRFRWVWRRDILRPLLSFSGWNLYGNLGSAAQHQGNNIVINLFFGVAMNAAVNIGLTVANTVNHFSSIVMTAFRPQIIKNYSIGEKDQMRDLTLLAIKTICFIYCLVAIPAFVESDHLLSIWLGNPPAHAAAICKLLLVGILFETLRYILIIDIHATGNVKWVSFTTGTLFTLSPLIVYYLFTLGTNVYAAFWVIISCHFVLCIFNCYLVQYYVGLGMQPYLLTIMRVILVAGIVLGLASISKITVPSILISLLSNTVLDIVAVTLAFAFGVFTANQRRAAIRIVRAKFHH